MFRCPFQVSWLVVPLIRASDALNQGLALGPDAAGTPPADAPACLRAPDGVRPAVAWALGAARAAGLRANLRPLAEYQSVFLLAVTYLLRGLILALLLWPPAVAAAVAAWAGSRAVRAYWPRLQRWLQRVWVFLEEWWKWFETLVA